jgi:phage baseplate assembly protein W
MHPDRAIEWYAATAEALDTGEPRFRLTRVRIAAASASGVLSIDLEGLYLPDGHESTLEGITV